MQMHTASKTYRLRPFLFFDPNKSTSYCYSRFAVFRTKKHRQHLSQPSLCHRWARHCLSFIGNTYCRCAFSCVCCLYIIWYLLQTFFIFITEVLTFELWYSAHNSIKPTFPPKKTKENTTQQRIDGNNTHIYICIFADLISFYINVPEMTTSNL